MFIAFEDVFVLLAFVAFEAAFLVFELFAAAIVLPFPLEAEFAESSSEPLFSESDFALFEFCQLRWLC